MQESGGTIGTQAPEETQEPVGMPEELPKTEVTESPVEAPAETPETPTETKPEEALATPVYQYRRASVVAKITKISVNPDGGFFLFFGGDSPITVGDEFNRAQNPKTSGYYVKYEDGTELYFPSIDSIPPESVAGASVQISGKTRYGFVKESDLIDLSNGVTFFDHPQVGPTRRAILIVEEV